MNAAPRREAGDGFSCRRSLRRVRRQSVYKVACSLVELRLERVVIKAKYEGK